VHCKASLADLHYRRHNISLYLCCIVLACVCVCRTTTMDLFIKCGLRDSNGFLAQELESWDVYCVSDERITQMRSRCADWLDK